MPLAAWIGSATLVLLLGGWLVGCRGTDPDRHHTGLRGAVTPLATNIITYVPPPLPMPPREIRPPSVPADPPSSEASVPNNAPPSAESNSPAPPRTFPAPYRVTAPWLNLRMAAGADATRIGRLRQGTRVTVVAEQLLSSGERWWRVKHPLDAGRGYGWVASSYLEPAPADANGANPAHPKFAGFTNLVFTPIPKRAYPDNPRVDARGLYITRLTARSSRFKSLLKLAKDTAVNALVIDFKDDVGRLLTTSATAQRLNPNANQKVAFKDLAPFIKLCKTNRLYLIARIVTFKDPIYAAAHPRQSIWDRRANRAFTSRDGLHWVSPHDADFRAYNLGLAQEAARLGFNEVQFDYVRFPDVPASAKLDYRNPRRHSKAKAIQDFLLEARRVLEPLRVYVAADVFGLICTTVDDMRIGQYWEAVSNAADYICPMMYPSHYGPKNYGLAVPDQHPYEVIQHGLRDARKRNANLATPARIRPWIQGFTATWVKGHITYGPAQIQTQIKAAADQGIRSWLLWHPGNRYHAAGFKQQP